MRYQWLNVFRRLSFLEKNLSTQNTVITTLAADFAKFQADYNTFSTAVKTFIASVQNGNTGTVLSAEDSVTLSGIDMALGVVDTSVNAIAASLPAAPPAA